MEVGDRFICYHDKSAVVGTISKITSKTSYDIINGVKIVKREIISNTGDRHQYNECFKIDGDISPTFLKRVIRYIVRAD
jgi:hypothetical protein